MIDRVLEAIRGHAPASPTARWTWLALLLLFPLAYLGGSLLEHREVVRTMPALRVDRGAAIATAREFLANHGINATEWSSYVSVDTAEDALAYYQRRRDAATAQAQSFAPAIRVRVLLKSGADESAEVDVDRNGRVAGYDLTRLKRFAQASPLDETASAAIATAASEKIPNLTSLAPLGKPDMSTVETAKGLPSEAATRSGSCRNYKWHTSSTQLPGLNFEVHSSVCGATAAAQNVQASVDPAYRKAYPSGTPAALQIVFGVYILYIIVVIVYSLYRYARRAFDGEISHRRTLLLAAGSTVALLLMGVVTAIDEIVLRTYAAGAANLWMSLIAIAITYTLGGLLFALAFEAGEGDVREVAPGKMTSLDAFLRGKFFSRNVARALLSALTIAGWFLLLDGVFGLMRPASTSAMVRDALKLPFFRYPLLTIFMSQAITVTLIPATALLLPLAFVQRHVRRPRLRNVLLVAAVLLGCTLHTTRYTSFFNVVLGVLIPAACLLIGFLAVDFLTAVASLVAFEIAHSMSQLAALSPSWVHIGYGVAVIAAAIIAAELWAAFHGREYHDSEVRPLYARNIVERQRLQAEVAAAREAQLHLLPKSAPDIAGVSISAACIPARVVGGDFYDFFRLGDNRLGIFIAEGGNRGVASALNIALAKGFLMHTVRRGLPPHEIVTRLQAALGAFISGASASTYVAYAVLDTSVGRLSYARTGEYPKVLLSSKLVNERRVEIVGTEQFVYEGEVELRGGDTVLLVTDGIARKVRLGGSASAGDVLRALERKRRSTELDDDLTAVVVRIERVGSAVGVVA